MGNAGFWISLRVPVPRDIAPQTPRSQEAPSCPSSYGRACLKGAAFAQCPVPDAVSHREAGVSKRGSRPECRGFVASRFRSQSNPVIRPEALSSWGPSCLQAPGVLDPVETSQRLGNRLSSIIHSMVRTQFDRQQPNNALDPTSPRVTALARRRRMQSERPCPPEPRHLCDAGQRGVMWKLLSGSVARPASRRVGANGWAPGPRVRKRPPAPGSPARSSIATTTVQCCSLFRRPPTPYSREC
jgi:hypothetical protein